MTVKELIAILKKQPQDLQVVYGLHSEQCLVEPEQVHLFDGCAPRPDGWVQDPRPDRPTQKYLMFPGN